MITIENGLIRAQIDPMGAQLTSVVMDSREYLWQGDPAFWPRRAPVMFPVCGALPGGRYTLDGREYELPRHGYLKDTLLAVERQEKQSVGFLSRSDALTKAQYPFDYTLRLGYALDGRALSASAEVTNTGDGPMWFSVGSHEGWACPGGVRPCALTFPGAGELTAWGVRDGRLTGETTRIPLPGGVLRLDSLALPEEGLFFRTLPSRSVELRCGDGRGVSVVFADCDSLGLWGCAGAEFLCIEPWCGFFAPKDGDSDLRARGGIRRLEPGEVFTACHRMIFS